MQRIYSPKTARPAKLGHGARHYKVRLNEDVIIWRIANEIYDDPLSGVRELVANGLTAIENAISMGILRRGDAELSVNLTEDRQLVISDNGTGITHDVLEKVLRVMGNSSNFDGKKAGKFGMGFYAFSTLSSSVIIDTVAHDGTRFSAVCSDGMAFDVFEKTRRKGRGTTITLSLYSGEKARNRFGAEIEHPYIKAHKVLNMVRQIALMSRVRMTVKAGEQSSENLEWLATGNATFDASGIAKAAAEYGEEKLEPVILRNDEIEVAMLFNADPARVYLAGMPIECDAKLPLGVIVNLLDERTFEPMPSRESLSAGAGKRADAAVSRLVVPYLEQMWGITDGKTLKESPMAGHFLWAVDDGSMYYTESAYKRSRLGRMADELSETVFNGRARYASTRNLLGIKNASVMEKADNCMRIALNRAKIGDDVYTFNQGKEKRAAELAEKWGIPRTESLIKRHNVTVTTADRNIAALKDIWVRSNDRKLKETTADKLPKDALLIMAPERKMTHVRSVIFGWGGKTIGLIMHDPDLRHPRVIKYEDWIKRIGRRKIKTNRGTIPVSSIIEPHGQYYKARGDLKNGSLASKSKKLIILNNPLEPFESAALLDETGAEWKLIDEDDVKAEIASCKRKARAEKRAEEQMAEVERIAPGLSGIKKRVVRHCIVARRAKYPSKEAADVLLAMIGSTPEGDARQTALLLYRGVIEAGITGGDREQFLAGLARGLGFNPFTDAAARAGIISVHLGAYLSESTVEKTGADGVFTFEGVLEGGELEARPIQVREKTRITMVVERVRYEQGRVRVSGTARFG